MTAACLGMPAALPFAASLLGGFEGSDLSVISTGIDTSRVEGGLAIWTIMRDERPMSASVAAAAANHGYVYAAGAGNTGTAVEQLDKKQSQHHAERAFRGPEPWRKRT
jgi:hypothetical protein